MIITKGNIRFIKLKEEDIELVRHWRNSPVINQFMEFREYITPEKQHAWFNSINNKYNLYFVIEYEYQKVGLINGKDIDWDKKVMEVGIFFWEEKLYNTPLPALSTLVFSELGVRYAGLSATAHILRTNHRAIHYNTELGFELQQGQDIIENQEYLLTPERYMTRAKRLRKAFLSLINRDPIVLLLEKEDYDIGIAQLIEPELNPEYIESVEGTEEGKVITFV